MQVSLVVVVALLNVTPDEQWTNTFDPARVGGYVPQGHQRLLVVGVGEAAVAASFLAAGLHLSPPTPHVMSGDTLGTVSELSDQEILQRAGTILFTQLVVVRAVPARGESPRMKVVAYDPEGSEVWTFTATAGDPAPQSPRGAAATRPRPVPRTFSWKRVFDSEAILQVIPYFATVALFTRGSSAAAAGAELERRVSGFFVGIESVSRAERADGSDLELIAPVREKLTRIAVLRTFGREGDVRPPSATLAVYAANGALIEVLYSDDGRPLERVFRAERFYAYDPMSIYGGDVGGELLDQMITIQHTVHFRALDPPAHSFRFLLGRKRREVTMPRFLELVGREDLGEVQRAHEQRKAAHYLMLSASLGLGLGGALFCVLALPGGAYNPMNVAIAVPLGVGGMVGAIYLMFANARFFAPVIDPERMFDLAAQHNERVIRRFVPKPARPRPAASLQLRLGLGPGGIALAGNF